MLFCLLLFVECACSLEFTQLLYLGDLTESCVQKFLKVIGMSPVHFSIDGRASQDILLVEAQCDGAEEGGGFTLNAIFDGHGGSTEEYLPNMNNRDRISKANLVSNLLSGIDGECSIFANLVKQLDSLKSSDEEALVLAVQSACSNANENLTEGKLESEYRKTYKPEYVDVENLDFGSTLTGLLELGGMNKAILMNVGDSPAFIITQKGQVYMNHLHDADNRTEVERMEKEGKAAKLNGRHFGGYVSVSRDFGAWTHAAESKAFKPIPYVYSLELNNDLAAVILMSDGIPDYWKLKQKAGASSGDKRDSDSKLKGPVRKNYFQFIKSFVKNMDAKAISSEKDFKVFLRRNEINDLNKIDDRSIIIKPFVPGEKSSSHSRVRRNGFMQFFNCYRG
jgi:serine/threonine protein phosphatase PrpC